jgi:hypothetical protein
MTIVGSNKIPEIHPMSKRNSETRAERKQAQGSGSNQPEKKTKSKKPR